MRVAVKNMSGVFIHSTTPRKARLLLKEKKAVIESNNPFIIRLLFSESECGLKDSKSLNKLESDNKSEKDNNMCGNEETNVLSKTLNEFYVFILQSIRHILNSTDVDKVTWYTKNSANALGENDPDSFADTLHSAGRILFSKNHRVFGNYVFIGDQGFNILKKIRSPRVSFNGDTCIIDSLMKVKYIPSMEENRFIVSVYEPIDFDEDSDYKVYYNLYKKDYNYFHNIDDIVVGEIVDGERPNENIEAKSEMNDKHETLNTNSIKHDSKTHLIFGAIGCGKTTLFKQLIQEKLHRDEDVFVLGTKLYGRLYFNDKSNNNPHFYSPSDMSGFSSKSAPKDLAEYIVNFCYSVVGKDNTRTIAIDGFEQFELNPDYTTSEYFRELAKECRTNDINFLYTLGVDSDKKESYHRLPEIYERFSDIITVLK